MNPIEEKQDSIIPVADSEITELPIEVELLDITSDVIERSGYVAIPVSEASSYGVMGSELLQMIDGIKASGGEGI